MIKLLWNFLMLIADKQTVVMPYENHHLVCPWHGRINAWDHRGKTSCGCHVEHHWHR